MSIQIYSIAATDSSSSKYIQDAVDGVERTFRTEELSRDVEGLASYNDNLLSVEELLSHGGSQTTKEMTLAIDRDLCLPYQSAAILLNCPCHASPASILNSSCTAAPPLIPCLADGRRKTHDWLKGRHFVLFHEEGDNLSNVCRILYLRDG